MAYRRRQQQQGILPSAPAADDLVDVEVNTAKAIRASSAREGSSLSAAYGYASLHSSSAPLSTTRPPATSKDPQSHQYTSLKNLDESKQGFWSSLGRKAKAFLDDDNEHHQFESGGQAKSELHQGPTPEKEGLTIVENRMAGIIQETRKHIRKKPSGSMAANQAAKQPQMQHQERTSVQADMEIQLKASRDVRLLWLWLPRQSSFSEN